VGGDKVPVAEGSRLLALCVGVGVGDKIIGMGFNVLVGEGVAVNCIVLVGLGDEVDVFVLVNGRVGVVSFGAAAGEIVRVIVGNMLASRLDSAKSGLLAPPSIFQAS